jgi:hypothetical protein
MNSPLFLIKTLCRFVSCAMRYALLLAQNASHQGKTNKGHLQMETYYYTRKYN